MDLRARVQASEAQRREAGLRLWYEAILIGGVYVAYSLVRNLFGSASVSPATAARNADWMIDAERAIGLYIEPDVQALFIEHVTFMQFWNLFYGLFHFLVTFLVLAWLYVADAENYRFWRRAGLVTTVSALIGYAIYPLMPPRLLGDCGPYGACRPASPYVDSVVELGGIWSFETSGMESISNQYAAMPSLHIGWALLCTIVLVPRVESAWAKGLALLYPWLTMFAIVVTANHYWIDGLGGIAVVLIGWYASRLWQRRDVGRTTRETASVDATPGSIGSTVDSGDASQHPSAR